MTAVQMTQEQFRELLNRITDYHLITTPGGDIAQNHAAVEEFITAANIFKDMEGISDQAAIAGLPLLLTAEANQWWNGVKSTIESWKHAIELIRKAFAPRRANHRLFLEIQDCVDMVIGARTFTSVVQQLRDHGTFNFKLTIVAVIGQKEEPEDLPTDKYVTLQRERLGQMSRELDEQWQLDVIYGLLRYKIRDRVPRTDIATFQELLERCRDVEENERESGTTKRVTPAAASAATAPANERKERTRIKCQFCKCFGHTAQECRKQKR
ncbi:activity-regulated cytoskeleton associated protein 2-like [Zophobas morio]|uniref:activity-regulated cytoskeleton associated protein 2-like n=1 Tax=Zophobas morio TaxID=2755281 RepID=UPI003082B76D